MHGFVLDTVLEIKFFKSKKHLLPDKILISKLDLSGGKILALDQSPLM